MLKILVYFQPANVRSNKKFMNKEPKAILLRFPGYSKIIRQQIKENEYFESLCRDYELCMEMLASIEKEADAKNFKLEEYLHIKKQLENEALKYLVG